MTRSRIEPESKARISSLLEWWGRREIIPDPRGWLGLSLAGGVLLCHLCLPGPSAGFLFSEKAFLEILGHVWLLLGPPLALYLGVRHVLLRGDSLVPLLTVPLAFLLTALTAVGVTLALLG
jgi:hypothetical protein